MGRPYNGHGNAGRTSHCPSPCVWDEMPTWERAAGKPVRKLRDGALAKIKAAK
jgi:hypothetical protein